MYKHILIPTDGSETAAKAVDAGICDAIFIGSHGRRGLARLWHGSQTAEVLTHSEIPTLVFR